MEFNMNFDKEYLCRKTTAEKWLEELSPNGAKKQEIIYKAMNYSVNAGGKRIRPVIMMSVCKMLKKDFEEVKYFACALEFIHTYSLIHDDLPCMDDDDLRRGIPTNHKVFGDALAVLAGDSLLNYAFETALNSKTKPEITINAMKVLADASGKNGMIGGQVIDINGVDNLEDLINLHRLKTGAIIKAAAVIGAIIGGAEEKQLDAIKNWAENIGLAFQIKDDILDVIGNEETLGKPIGSDKDENKNTFVSLQGLEKSKKDLEELTNKAINELSIFEDDAEFLKKLSVYLLKREK